MRRYTQKCLSQKSRLRIKSLDCYWVDNNQARLDEYRDGKKAGLFYRSYRKPDEGVFFTNEKASNGGLGLLVEIWKKKRLDRAGGFSSHWFGNWNPSSTADRTSSDYRNTQEFSVNNSHDITIDGLNRKEIIYDDKEATYRIVLAPEKNNQPILLECIYKKTERNSAIIELQSLNGPKDAPIWFPKRIVYRQVREENGKMIEILDETVEEVKEIKIDAVTPESFTLAALEIPVGHTVYDTRTMKTGPWNGKQVEYIQDARDLVMQQVHVRNLKIFFLVLGIILLSFALIIRRRRRFRLETKTR